MPTAPSGTDYVDICGEPAFIEEMRLKYHEDAKRTGALVVRQRWREAMAWCAKCVPNIFRLVHADGILFQLI